MSSKQEISTREQAAFEAGIKLGALYHQFVGAPVNMDTVESLETAIQKSISVQPFVENINVSIDRKMIQESLNDTFGYCELQGRMLLVRLNVIYKDARIDAKLEYDGKLGYPLMSIIP